jgi:hypothetical protein
MKQILIALTILSFAVVAVAGDGYKHTGSKGIMRFVQVDEDKAKDVDTYKRAIAELCTPDARCQVLFWTENAPVDFPFSREQVKGQKAYWQFSEKSGTHRLYVDCKFFGDVEDAECL